jgi:hypothetical protein
MGVSRPVVHRPPPMLLAAWAGLRCSRPNVGDGKDISVTPVTKNLPDILHCIPDNYNKHQIHTVLIGGTAISICLGHMACINFVNQVSRCIWHVIYLLSHLALNLHISSRVEAGELQQRHESDFDFSPDNAPSRRSSTTASPYNKYGSYHLEWRAIKVFRCGCPAQNQPSRSHFHGMQHQLVPAALQQPPLGQVLPRLMMKLFQKANTSVASSHTISLPMNLEQIVKLPLASSTIWLWLSPS